MRFSISRACALFAVIILPNICLTVNANAVIYVPAEAYPDYKAETGKYNRTYAIIESIESKSVTLTEPEAEASIAVTPAHPGINSNFSVISDDADPSAEVRVSSVENGEIRLTVKALHTGTTIFELHPQQPGTEPAELTVKVQGTVGIDDTEADRTVEKTVYYDLYGRKVADPQSRRGDILIAKPEGKPGYIRLPQSEPHNIP